MPNIPSSVAQTPAKKRKLSSISTSSAISRNFASIDVPMQQQPSNEQAHTGPSVDGQTISNESYDQADIDDSILNSDVYKIYFREKDPEEAMKKIKELKNCILFETSTRSFPAEEDFKAACETTLDRLWNYKPYLSHSKFEKIKRFVREGITLFELSKSNDKIPMITIFEGCLTKIKMLRPNRCEFWYIANFDKGPGKSKWYRAESIKGSDVDMLAQLNVMGLKNSTISKLQYDHYITKKNSIKNEWFDVAYDLIRHNVADLMDKKWCTATFVTRFKSEGEVTATLMLRYVADNEGCGWKVAESYHGKSTRQVSKKEKSKEKDARRSEMVKEAKIAALKECFRERFGFTEFKDVVSDELNRPIKV